MQIVTKISIRAGAPELRVTAIIAGEVNGFTETGKAYLSIDGSRLFLSREPQSVGEQKTVFQVSRKYANYIKLPRGYFERYSPEYMTADYQPDGIIFTPYSEKEKRIY